MAEISQATINKILERRYGRPWYVPQGVTYAAACAWCERYGYEPLDEVTDAHREWGAKIGITRFEKRSLEIMWNRPMPFFDLLHGKPVFPPKEWDSYDVRYTRASRRKDGPWTWPRPELTERQREDRAMDGMTRVVRRLVEDGKEDVVARMILRGRRAARA